MLAIIYKKINVATFLNVFLVISKESIEEGKGGNCWVENLKQQIDD